MRVQSLLFWKALTFLDLQLDMVWQNQLKQFLEML